VEGLPRVSIQLVRRPELLAPRIERIRGQLIKGLADEDPG
jgi:hypothetical protein